MTYFIVIYLWATCTEAYQAVPNKEYSLPQGLNHSEVHGFEVNLFLIGFEFDTLCCIGLLDFPPKFLSCLRHSLSRFQNESSYKMTN